ncbi:OmpA family protein [Profundibacterium mesophilum]|uniref:OmpA family protein n=1 Tax=Profundibacterium mesophilum KAUST100406-0324 TaxID=1037889 RepID=A0A921TFV0_9RHOB|nr:OmpA family protein [Profundibacterium mesophilum]KAF0676799.1 OmpA family protein [Profundibacterium mesophilum KAUST100406-0324]
MRQNLKMSTALVAVLSLVAPSGVSAQEAAEGGNDTTLTCMPGFEALCADLEALESEKQQIETASQTAGEDAAAGAMEDVDARIEEIRAQIEEAQAEAGITDGSENGGAIEAQPATPAGETTAIQARPANAAEGDNDEDDDRTETGGTPPAEMGANTGASGGSSDQSNAGVEANGDVSGENADSGMQGASDGGDMGAANGQAGADAGAQAEPAGTNGGAIEAQPASPAGETIATEAQPATPQTGANADAGASSDMDAGTGADTDTGSDMNAGASAGAQADPASTDGGAIEAQPVSPAGDTIATEAQPTTSQSGASADTDSNADTGTDMDAGADADADADAGADTDADAGGDTNAGTNADAQTGAASQDGSDAMQADTNTNTDTAAGAAAPEAGDKPAQASSGNADNGEQAPVAALAAGNAEGGAEPTVERQTVTEENSRSSAEDFDTKIAQEAAPAGESAEQTANANDDDGLSTLEKALLAGAGAIAVGSLLSGNREVVARSDDRVVVSRDDGSFQLIKDDDTLLRRPGSEVETQTFSDGSTRTVVTREDGSQIITVRDPELRVLRRVRVGTDGSETVLIDDTLRAEPVDVSRLPEPRSMQPVSIEVTDRDALRAALEQQGAMERTFSLAQVRNISEVRTLAPAVDLSNITFASGSAAIPPAQAEELVEIGDYIRGLVEQNPSEVVLIEGHTDAVGDGAYNLALSDRRAESVALALTEYFDVPPENLVVQGYGEQFLKVETSTAEQANRRATVRRITPLLREVASAN